GAYLTVNPNLKTILDLLDRKQPSVSLAVDTQAAARGHIPPLGLTALEKALNAAAAAKLALKTLFEESGVLGAALQLRDGLELTLAEDCRSEEAARRRSTTIRTESGPELAKMLTAALGTTVEMLEDNANNPDNNPFGGTDARNPNPSPR